MLMCVWGIYVCICICISERQTHVLYAAVFLSVCNMCYCAGVPTACQWNHQSRCYLLAHPLNGAAHSSGSGIYIIPVQVQACVCVCVCVCVCESTHTHVLVYMWW